MASAPGENTDAAVGQVVGRRVLCPVCGKRVPLTRQGVLRKHRTYTTVCPQSGSEVPERPLIHVSDCPLLVGDHKPLHKIQAPQCGRRAVDDMPIVMPGLVWVGDIVTDPEVLRQHAAALLEAATWLAGAPKADTTKRGW